MLSKNEIREICREKLAKIAEKEEKSFRLREELLPILSRCNHIAIFASLKDEIDTFPLIEALLKLDKSIYLPRVEKQDINFYQIHSLDELKVSDNKYRIREPQGDNPVNPNELEVIVCPGVAFDNNNNRLGHGKGYYDRYLLTCSAYKIGICYKEQLFIEIPTNDQDIKMDEVYAY